MITITAFKWVPPVVRGLVRDLRVRWALEEAGIPYKVNLITLGPEQNSPEYRALQPFGQVPAMQDGELSMFESGSIVMHIGNKSPILLPHDPHARARAITWIFAALSSVEVFTAQLIQWDLSAASEGWWKQARPAVEQLVKKRLHDLAQVLKNREYLEGEFTAGDLMMTTVLRQLHMSGLLATEPKIASYVDRCEARPAFKRALAAQLADYDKNAPHAAPP